MFLSLRSHNRAARTQYPFMAAVVIPSDKPRRIDAISATARVTYSGYGVDPDFTRFSGTSSGVISKNYAVRGSLSDTQMVNVPLVLVIARSSVQWCGADLRDIGGLPSAAYGSASYTYSTT